MKTKLKGPGRFLLELLPVLTILSQHSAENGNEIWSATMFLGWLNWYSINVDLAIQVEPHYNGWSKELEIHWRLIKDMSNLWS